MRADVPVSVPFSYGKPTILRIQKLTAIALPAVVHYSRITFLDRRRQHWKAQFYRILDPLEEIRRICGIQSHLQGRL